MTPLRTSLAMLLLAVTLTARQEVTITGVVEPAGPVICAAATHQIDCTSVQLTSDVVDLDMLLGKNVRLTGKQIANCPLIRVDEVNPFPPATLVRCGSPTPGCPMRWRVGPPALGQFFLFISQTPAYLPVNATKGTFLLGSPFFTIASGMTGGPEAVIDIIIPDTPVIVGLDAWLQAARRDIGPVGPWALSNAICFTITGPSPPCEKLDC